MKFIAFAMWWWCTCCCKRIFLWERERLIVALGEIWRKQEVSPVAFISRHESHTGESRAHSFPLRGADHENTAAAPSVLRCYIAPIQDLASLYLGKSGSLDMNIVGPCVVDWWNHFLLISWRPLSSFGGTTVVQSNWTIDILFWLIVGF